MAELDLPVDQLRTFTASLDTPEDLDAFWEATLAESRAARRPTEISAPVVDLPGLTVRDVTFSGFGGDPIRAWLATPKGATDLPVVVEYIGYGGGRGLPYEYSLLPAAGYAHLIMDTRGQASAWGNGGDTADPHATGPSVPGFMTRGIESPETYYYRRVFTDATLAVDVARELPGVDAGRVAVKGSSQGGGIAIAAASLADGVGAALIDVPFLCNFPRAIRMTDSDPYAEIRRYLAVHRGGVEAVHQTLAYFDGANLAPRATAPSVWSVAIMDDICPPSTVYSAYNAYAGPKSIVEYAFNGHEGGQMHQVEHHLALLEKALTRQPAA
ncbi:acetylxylan esterase [Demequina subtropica]|uniref:acetylxylan esterase n=1 Tax=Demequina subtropica TaxID=1638989 RepID=UPI000786818D|nr:acetylxylan esterase [Demequina subtropica]